MLHKLFDLHICTKIAIGSAETRATGSLHCSPVVYLYGTYLQVLTNCLFLEDSALSVNEKR